MNYGILCLNYLNSYDLSRGVYMYSYMYGYIGRQVFYITMYQLFRMLTSFVCIYQINYYTVVGLDHNYHFTNYKCFIFNCIIRLLFTKWTML